MKSLPVVILLAGLTMFGEASGSAHGASDTPPHPSHGTGSGQVSQPVPHNAQTAVVKRYLNAMRTARYAAAFDLLDDAERAYYGNPQNFASIYAADAYRIDHFTLIAARTDGERGRVYFARETARFRDHAHDIDLLVSATVPLGVVPEHGGWRIKDPGHPWRAFASRASANSNGVRVSVKKMSFFPHRIEAVVSFVNVGSRFVTVLPYGRSILHDTAGRPYRIIETTDWSLTDKTLFEGLRLAPDAEYTGTLGFAGDTRGDSARAFTLTVAPLLVDGADSPFEIEVDQIAAVASATR